MARDKFMIIDGSSLLYRGFYALPLLSTREGIYTNGIYGFLTMLYKVVEERKPSYLSVVFDMKGPTFRHEEYDAYKANRMATPSELVQQFPIIREVLDAMNIKYIEISGFEADDIAGTLAKKAEDTHDVILVTGDRDYLQLASDTIKVLITKKGITDLGEYDRDKIIEEYGISPDQLIDLKGLMGDASDNIPGVPGIGEKTGLKLLKEYGSIDNIYENLDSISGKKLKENLTDNKHLAYLSRKLGEIICHVPLDIDLEDLKILEPNYEETKEIFKKLECSSLLRKLKPMTNGNGNSTETIDYKYSLVEDYESLLASIKDHKKFAFKLITENNIYIKEDILYLAIRTDKTYLLKIDSIDKFVSAFKEVFEDQSIEKLSHDIKGDYIGLWKLGISLRGVTFDSMVAAYLLDPTSSFTVNAISGAYLERDYMTEEDLLGKGKGKKTYKDLSEEELGKYLSFSLASVMDLQPLMTEKINENNMEDLFYGIELPLVEVLASMELYGFKIDEDELKAIGKDLDEEIISLTEGIYEDAGEDFNINSPKQLGVILFDKLDLPVVKKTKTGYSTDAEVLDKLMDSHPIIGKILRYRQIVKLKSTYIDGLLSQIDETSHRVHSSFNQTITATGRISSTEPNLQNIPIRTEDGRKIRKAFVSMDDYVLVDGDYSQIELRVLAHISEDPKLMEAFINKEDIHRKTASEVLGIPLEEVTSSQRSSAKAVNFGIIYGISDFGLSRDLNIPRKQAKDYIENYLKNYIKVKEYMEEIVKLGKDQGYVETILNRRRYIPELSAKNFNIKAFGERIAMNTPIQGSAADIIKKAMVEVYRELNKRKLKSRLILQIHDELIIEAHKDEKDEVKSLMKDIMESSVVLSVPLVVDIEVGESWYDTK